MCAPVCPFAHKKVWEDFFMTRKFLSAVLAIILVLSAVPLASAAIGWPDVLVDNFDSPTRFSRNLNAIAEWQGCTDMTSFQCANNELRLQYPARGASGGTYESLFSTPGYKYVVFRMKGAVGGEQSAIQISLGNLAAKPMTDYGLAPLTTRYQDYCIDLAANGSNSSGKIIFNFGYGSAGTVFLDSIYLTNTAPAPPSGDTTAPSVPSGLTATATSASSLSLSWTASTDNVGVAGYQIFRNGALLGTTAVPAYTDASCSPATFYLYWIKAFDAAGNFSATATVSAITKSGAGGISPYSDSATVPAGRPALIASPVPDSSLTSRALTAGSAPLDNPLKSSAYWSSQAARDRTCPYSLQWCYFGLGDLMTGPNTFNWDKIEYYLRDCEAKGKQGTLRVVTSLSGSGNKDVPAFLSQYIVPNIKENKQDANILKYNEEPVVKAFEDFVRAFGQRFDGDPRIGFIHMGLIGKWGEWHTSPQGSLMANDATCNRVITAYNNAFKVSRLELRYAKIGGGKVLKTMGRIGFHDDSFAFKTSNGSMTLPRSLGGESWPSFVQDMLNTGQENKWLTASIGGEVRPEIQDVFTKTNARKDDTVTAIEVAHATWMIHYKNYVKATDSADIEIMKKFGYTFTARNSYFKNTVPNNAPMKVGIRIENTGCAPFYYSPDVWPVQIGLKDSGGNVVKYMNTSWDLRRIKPSKIRNLPDWGVSVNQTYVDLAAPYYFDTHLDMGGVASGNYTVVMRVPNPAPYGRPLMFANTAQQADGWLNLGSVAVTEAGGGGTEELAAEGEPGTYNPGDIAVINAIIDNNGLKWTKAPADGSSVPNDWWSGFEGILYYGVNWSNDSTNKQIIEIRCPNRDLTGNLDLRGLNALEILDCYSNQLTKLDVSSCIGLKELVCYGSKLTSLNVDGCTALTILNCGASSEKNGSLISLNALTKLDVSSCTALEKLICDNNQLTTLNISKNAALTDLNCYSNQLSTLDVSKNSKLKYLYCLFNRLTTLDVSNNNELTHLSCCYNYIPSKAAVIGWQNIPNFYFDPQNVAVESVKLSASAKTLTVGGAIALTATVSPSNADQAVSWKSSKTSVATADSDGKVTAKAPGKATITVTTKDGGKKATCVITVKPKKPTSVNTKVVSATSAKISWGKVSGVSGYEVRRAASKTGSYSVVKNTSGTSFTNTGLTAGKTYYYKVRAYKTIDGKKVYGAYSKIVSVKPKPLKVTGVKATKVKSGQAKISWSKQANVSGYQIVRATSKNGTYKSVGTTTKLTFKNTKLTAGKTYYYKVRAYKTVDGKKVYGAYSSIKSVKV